MIKNYSKKLLRGKALAEYKKTLTMLSQEQQDVLTGTLLGDASIEKGIRETICPVKGEQKVSQNDYINHLYEIFNVFILMVPTIRTIKANATIKERQSYGVRTISHPLLFDYKNMFYDIDNDGNYCKKLPDNIKEMLTPRALTYGYMDDGHKEPYGFSIATQNFSYKEHLLLKKIFLEKYNIKITIRKTRTIGKKAKKTVWYIYIPAKYKNIFNNIIKAYIIPSFEYKLHNDSK